MAQKLDPLIAIVGETASGKSALALELAEKFGGEIICADSWTVYKEFDVGTAKPSIADQARVPHHLLDIAEPAQGFSAALFKDLAVTKINEITARGKVPFLVGGTGLYIDAVLYDYGFLPAPDERLRAQLTCLNLEELLHKATSQYLDISTIDTRNKRRLIRLIENNGALPTKEPLRSNTLLLGFSVAHEDLKSKVVERVDAMLRNGLEQEVAWLSDKYGWEVEPMKGIGYREWRLYFDDTITRDDTRQKIVASTMDLAKKQRTWFRRPLYNKSIQWIHDKSEVVDLVTTYLNK